MKRLIQHKTSGGVLRNSWTEWTFILASPGLLCCMTHRKMSKQFIYLYFITEENVLKGIHFHILENKINIKQHLCGTQNSVYPAYQWLWDLDIQLSKTKLSPKGNAKEIDESVESFCMRFLSHL